LFILGVQRKRWDSLQLGPLDRVICRTLETSCGSGVVSTAFTAVLSRFLRLQRRLSVPEVPPREARNAEVRVVLEVAPGIIVGLASQW